MPSTSRISGACVGCRSKKQKCSGDRTGCAQCLAAGIECLWPEQRKRGPAKGYIEALESRLHAAESLLLAILPHINETVLEEATSSSFTRASRASSETSGMDVEERKVSRGSPPPVNKKTGVEYWENFPLDTVSNIRRWQQACEAHSTAAQTSSSRSRTHSQPKTNPPFAGIRNEDEFRSSASAAAVMAGMRHGTNSPGTPNSNSASSMMVATVGSRSLYDSGMSPSRSMSMATGQTQTTPTLPPHLQRQQPQQPPPQSSVWYQQYPQQSASMNVGVNMNMGVDTNYPQDWSNTQPSNAMDVDSSNIAQAMGHASQSQPGQHQHPHQHPSNGSGGLYSGDYPTNTIFW